MQPDPFRKALHFLWKVKGNVERNGKGKVYLKGQKFRSFPFKKPII